MADEIVVEFQPDETNVFVCVRDMAGQVMVVSAGSYQSLETWVDGNVATYAIDVAEKGGGGWFYADFPTGAPAGFYHLGGYQGAKDGSADGLGGNLVEWDGSVMKWSTLETQRNET